MSEEYPAPRNAAATATMRSNRRRDTGPELAVRRELHRRGLRFFVDRGISAPGGRPIRPDVVFPRTRLAVFIDGCFWHGCPDHHYAPKHNDAYWGPKIRRNRDRDMMQNTRLASERWTVIRFWEHEDPKHVADRVQASLGGLTPSA